MEENGRGYITFSIRTAGGALPVNNAMITISFEGNVVAVVYSDSGGSSEVVELPAPPRSNSLSPGSENVAGFYTVDTDRAGYFHVTNHNVPIYDGITSVQQVIMIPLEIGSPTNAPSGLTEFDGTPRLPNL